MTRTRLPNIHAGEILLHEFIEPLGLSQTKLAKSIGVPPRRINEICLQKRAISPDTALRLARFFGTTPQFWLGLQNDYDLEEASNALNVSAILPMQPDQHLAQNH